MSLSSVFIRRPVMTTLLMASVLFLGLMAYRALPVSDLPNVDYPTIEVTTSYPGANPDTMANTVTSPLEREFTSIDGIQTIASSSTNGSSTIVLQFDLGKSLVSAATDVQAAINRASPNLPSDLPNAPTYKKTNPAQSPVMYIAVTSDGMSLGDLYEYAYSLMGRRLGMAKGVSDVDVYGSKFAVRVQVDPDKLAAHQVGIDQVADALIKSTPQKPVGNLYGPDIEYTIDVKGQMHHAEGYNNLIIRNNNQALLRVKDIGQALDSLEQDKYSLNFITQNGNVPSVVIAIVKQAGANTIEVVSDVKKLIEEMKWELPGSIKLHNIFDESLWIMESVRDVQITLFVAFLLVLIVVLFYLGKVVDTIIPIIALPLSIIGTFAMMYLYGFNIDILSLLAITLSVGFLVDDAIVVLENVTRHVEMGKNPKDAAIEGAKQISFTILAMTLSLASIFIPMVFMEGIIGRIFREFAVTIMTAVIISGFIALSLTPMLCSRFITPNSDKKKKNWIERCSDTINAKLLNTYKRGLTWVFKHKKSTLLAGLGCLMGTIGLLVMTPADFLPPDDLGFIQGFGMASDSTSPYKMIDYQKQVADIIIKDPNVENLVSVGAIPNSNQSMMFIRLKNIKERKPMAEVIPELFEKANQIPGLQVFLRPMPLINLDVGTSSSMGNYQHTLQGIRQDSLYKSVNKLLAKMKASPYFRQVTSDLHNQASYLNIEIDRDRAYDLNVSAEAIERTFMYAYAAGQLTLINGVADQYELIIETLPNAYKDPSVLDKLYVSASTKTPPEKGSSDYNTLVPLSAITNVQEKAGPLSIAHINTLSSATISYDLPKGLPLSTALQKLDALDQESLSEGVSAVSLGAAQVFQSTFRSLFFLSLVTLFAVYVILGILYENFVHPVTVMSALPPAAFGAMITLYLFGQPLSLYAFVGIIMLLGIVLKNGIMLVDFANDGISQGKDVFTAIYDACCQRFRPIIMTTFAAMMGAVPIALGIGGLTAASRRPLGLVIVGGLIISQVLTLFFTPVIFLFLEKLRKRFGKPKKNAL